MSKQYKSSKIKNKKKLQRKNLMGVLLKGYMPLKLFLDLAPEMKNSIVGISSY